ncbi:hypothetical protein, partial [Nonomuraea zeae]
HPPSRFEPVDTWRELYMAAQLQRLQPRHHRVLFVCNATHVRPIQQLIRRPSLLADVDRSVLPQARYRIWDPSLPILVRYLDYIPRLVERYEKTRAAGRGHEFDKRTALLELIYQINQEAKDLRFSIRHYQAFSQILTKLLEAEKRISPQFETVLLASGSCFNSPFRERVFRHLIGYFDQVKAERIGRIKNTKESLFEISVAAPSDSEKIYVARNCSHFEHSYEIVYAPADHQPDGDGPPPESAPDMPPGPTLEVELDNPRLPRKARRPFSGGNLTASSWPPADAFINDMRSKAYGLAKAIGSKQVKSVEFRGSLQDGMDFRRTLRSYYKGRPKLYVRQAMPRERKSVDRNEPVMWLFDGYDSAAPDDTASVRPATARCEFASSYSGSDFDQRITDWFLQKPLTDRPDLKNKYGEAVRVTAHELYGRVSFKDWGLTLDEMRARLGGDLDRRVPLSHALDDALYSTWHLAYRYDLDLSAERWWEIMLVAAVHYAKENVVLFTPPKFAVPVGISALAAAHGKGIVHVPLAKFTHEEQRRLRVQYFLEHQYAKTYGDINDPEYRGHLVSRFADVMKLFWE